MTCLNNIKLNCPLVSLSLSFSLFLPPPLLFSLSHTHMPEQHYSQKFQLSHTVLFPRSSHSPKYMNYKRLYHSIHYRSCFRYHRCEIYCVLCRRQH